LEFESGSKLTRIEASALYNCSSSKSACLAASLEFLGERSFSRCTSLSSLTFESGSKLTRIKEYAVSECLSLKSLSLPASLQIVDGSALANTGLSNVTIEAGNCYFRIPGDFLLDFEGISLIRYLGFDSHTTFSVP
jgi:hypothetical protein